MFGKNFSKSAFENQAEIGDEAGGGVGSTGGVGVFAVGDGVGEAGAGAAVTGCGDGVGFVTGCGDGLGFAGLPAHWHKPATLQGHQDCPLLAQGAQ